MSEDRDDFDRAVEDLERWITALDEVDLTPWRPFEPSCPPLDTPE